MKKKYIRTAKQKDDSEVKVLKCICLRLLEKGGVHGEWCFLYGTVKHKKHKKNKNYSRDRRDTLNQRLKREHLTIPSNISDKPIRRRKL